MRMQLEWCVRRMTLLGRQMFSIRLIDPLRVHPLKLSPSPFSDNVGVQIRSWLVVRAMAVGNTHDQIPKVTQ